MSIARIEMLLRALMALGLTSASAQVLAPSVLPTYFPLPPVVATSSSAGTQMQQSMIFGTATLPAVDIAFANSDYTAHYILTRALSCGMGITSTVPITFTQDIAPRLFAPLLNATEWVAAARAPITAACSTPSSTPTAKAPVPTVISPSPSGKFVPSTSPSGSPTMRVPYNIPPASPTGTVRVLATATASPMVIQIPSSQSATMTPKIIEPPSQSTTMTPKAPEPTVAPIDIIMPPPDQPSMSATMTPKVFELTSQSASIDIIMPPPDQPSMSATMTPKIPERPSESTTPTSTVRVMERPSESATMTPRIIEQPLPSTSATPTSTIRVMERPSESATMTPKIVEQQPASESATMTPKIVEQQSASESASITPTRTVRVVEQQSEYVRPTAELAEQRPSGTLSPKVNRNESDHPYPNSTIRAAVEESELATARVENGSPEQRPTATLRGSTTRVQYSRKPLYVSPSRAPSKYPIPSRYIQFVPSAVPQRTRAAAVPSPAIKPPIINTGITIPGANTTGIVQPDKLQQLQATLACALQTPVENIQIMNITYTDSAGMVHTIQFDRSIPQLSSNGSSACLVPGPAARRLQAVGASAGSVQIDYAIIDPPAEIVVMDSTQFIDTVVSAQVVQDYVAAVGGTAIAANVPAELFAAVAAAAAAPAAPAEAPAGTNNTTPVAAILGILGGVALIGLAVFVYQKRANKPIVRMLHVVEMNPVSRQFGKDLSERQIYLPNQTRV